MTATRLVNNTYFLGSQGIQKRHPAFFQWHHFPFPPVVPDRNIGLDRRSPGPDRYLAILNGHREWCGHAHRTSRLRFLALPGRAARTHHDRHETQHQEHETSPCHSPAPTFKYLARESEPRPRQGSTRRRGREAPQAPTRGARTPMSTFTPVHDGRTAESRTRWTTPDHDQVFRCPASCTPGFLSVGKSICRYPT